MKIATNEKFKNSQLKAFFLHYYFFEEIETVYLQPHLPCFDNNQFKNDTVRASEPTKPNKKLDFLYP